VLPRGLRNAVAQLPVPHDDGPAIGGDGQHSVPLPQTRTLRCPQDLMKAGG